MNLCCPAWSTCIARRAIVSHADQVRRFLHKSQLLFSWFRSTIPGLRQVGNRGACGEREIREFATLRQGPNLAEHGGARRLAALFALDDFLDRLAERIERWVGAAPRIAQAVRVIGLEDPAD